MLLHGQSRNLLEFECKSMGVETYNLNYKFEGHCDGYENKLEAADNPGTLAEKRSRCAESASRTEGTCCRR